MAERVLDAARQEAERPTSRTFDDHGHSVCDRPARFIVWGHLYEKRHKGPKCVQHLPPHQGTPWLRMQSAIYEIPVEHAHPVPVVVSAEQREAVRRAIWQTSPYIDSDRYPSDRRNVDRITDAVLAALGIEVSDGNA